jgi:type II secretory pathway pseudopilin PulG
MKYTSRSANNKGFTLVEMIVAMGLFMTVVLITTGSLLLLVDAQRRTFALRETYDNLRFAMETIAKDLRTGIAYHCEFPVLPNLPLFQGQDCPGGADNITYTNSKKQQVTYSVNVLTKRLEKSVGSFYCAVPGTCDLTSKDLTIQSVTFYVIGTEDPLIHPRVTIVMVAKAGTGRSETTFTMQTTITQRKVTL